MYVWLDEMWISRMTSPTRQYGVRIVPLTRGYLVTVYGSKTYQREDHDTHATEAIAGSYKDAVECAVGYVREVLLNQAPIEP